MEDVLTTLEKRKKHYNGIPYKARAKRAQSLKRSMRLGVAWERLSEGQKEALEMIAHKIARIVDGDPDQRDHWHDIGGYAVLGECECCPDTLDEGYPIQEDPQPASVPTAKSILDDMVTE